MSKLMCAAALAILALTTFLIGCGGSGGGSLYMLSISRVKKLNDGMIVYASDYDDVLPGLTWMDAITPYVNNPDAFRSPAVEMQGYGYALNEALAGHSFTAFGNPAASITIFDSTDLSRNAVVRPDTQPIPPRYGMSNTIAYLDGHVKDEIPIDAPPASLHSRSRTRLKQVNMAMFLYSGDYDDYVPLANQWMDQLFPYTHTETIFHSPLIELTDANSFGYAFNIDIAGVSLSSLASPSTTLSFFDSTVLTRNATESSSTIPQPPRYGTKNTLAYADGSVP